MPMSAAESADFDVVALYAALDERRIALGLTWLDVADEVGVSQGTLTGLAGARHWISGRDEGRRLAGRPAASFTVGVAF